jgi:hypothetical protein
MSTPRFHFRITALFYLLVSLVCTQIPLLQSLGYEFSALLALVSSIVSGLTTARYMSRHAQGELRPQAMLLFRKALATHLLLLLFPLAIMAGNAVFIRNCSFPDGLFFFLLLPVVSVWFSVCLAAFCALHYRHPRLIFLGVVVFTLVYALAIGYLTPAIFSYNLFYGYFPGLTYDEGLRPDGTLLLFRILTIGLGAALLVPASILARATNSGDSTLTRGLALLRALSVPPRLWWAAALAVLLALVYVYRGELGFESPAGYVQERLGAVHETPHFIIYYSPKSFSPEEIRRAGSEHEFRLHQIMQIFRMPSYGRITSYIYPSVEMKRKLIGAGETNFAKPWSSEIHMHKQAMTASLKHELVHVMAAPFGVPVIRASLRPGLVEGLAMAIEWDWGNRTLHQYAAGIQRSGLSADIQELMSIGGFAARGSSVSYVLAGSFCRFLIDTYGIGLMTRLYRSGDFPGVYGTSLDELTTAWEKFLATVQVAGADSDGIDALFRRPPLFRKVCARVAGARVREAGMLLENGRFEDAARLYGQVFAETGGYESLSGYVASALRAGDIDAVLAVRDTIIRRDPHPGQYGPLFIYLGLAAWASGDTSGAAEMFNRVVQADVFEDRTETALLCRFAIQEPDNRAALLRYFRSGAADSVRLSALDSMRQDTQTHWLPLYLKGKVLARMQRREEEQQTLERIDLRNIDSTLEAFRLERIGTVLFDGDRPEEARVAFWTSLNYRSTEVWRLRIGEWIDRCEWGALKIEDRRLQNE